MGQDKGRVKDPSLGPDKAEIKGVPMALVGFVFVQSVVKKFPTDAVLNALP
jgi:hypothetical protein